MRLPSTATVFAAGLAGIMVVIVLAKGLTDPDFFTHVRTGQLIVESGQVPTTDPFSFTWAGQPWTLHEWLSEVVMYLLFSGIGTLPSLIVFGLIPGALLAILLYALVRRDVPLRPAALACVLSAWIFVPYVTFRPQAISWLLMAILVTFLWSLDAARPRRALWLLPLFVVWANIHGLWVVGLGVVALYVLFTVAGRTPMAGPLGRRWVAAAFVGCLFAVMLTPAGPAGVLYPLRYIDAGDWGLENIHEWQSPDFHGVAHWGLLTLILTLMAVGLRGGTPGWMGALTVLGVAMSLVSLRNAALLAVWSVPVVAMSLAARWPARLTPRPAPASQARTRRVMEAATAVAIVAISAVLVLPQTPAAHLDETVASEFPEAPMDIVLRENLDARILAEYGWGGYVIYRGFDSGARVFVDGRNDMYDQSILEDYSAIRAADPGWEELLASYRVEAMIWPTSVVLTRGLLDGTVWCEAYRDADQVLYMTNPDCPAE
ncbi:MAG: hypothetical protein ACRDFR_04880 [Candidatus Limnocylindria bacterium]